MTDQAERIRLLSSYISNQKFDIIQHIAAHRTRYATIVLEDLYLPQNISAIIRSVECLGIQNIHIIENKHACMVHNEVTKGAELWTTIIKYKNTITCLQQLKQQGYHIVATVPQAQHTLADLSLDKPIALIFGTERHGLSSVALEHADSSVSIPMCGFTMSYNVAVSVAMCGYDVTTRLRNSTYKWQLSADEQQELILKWLNIMINKANKKSDSVK